MSFKLPEAFAPTRVIAIVLTEEDWRAFMAIEPQPVAWVQRQIQERLAAETLAPQSPTS